MRGQYETLLPFDALDATISYALDHPGSGMVIKYERQQKTSGRVIYTIIDDSLGDIFEIELINRGSAWLCLNGVKDPTFRQYTDAELELLRAMRDRDRKLSLISELRANRKKLYKQRKEYFSTLGLEDWLEYRINADLGHLLAREAPKAHQKPEPPFGGTADMWMNWYYEMKENSFRCTYADVANKAGVEKSTVKGYWAPNYQALYGKKSMPD